MLNPQIPLISYHKRVFKPCTTDRACRRAAKRAPSTLTRAAQARYPDGCRNSTPLGGASSNYALRKARHGAIEAVYEHIQEPLCWPPIQSYPRILTIQ